MATAPFVEISVVTTTIFLAEMFATAISIMIAVMVDVIRMVILKIAVSVVITMAVPVAVVATVPAIVVPIPTIPVIATPPVPPTMPDISAPPTVIRAGIPARTSPSPTEGPIAKSTQTSKVHIDIFIR